MCVRGAPIKRMCNAGLNGPNGGSCVLCVARKYTSRECRMYRLCGRKIFHRYVFFNIFVF